MPLVISPETTELRVGQALRLQLAPDPSAAGEIQWYFESAPLPGQTGPVCRCYLARLSRLPPPSERAGARNDAFGCCAHRSRARCCDGSAARREASRDPAGPDKSPLSVSPQCRPTTKVSIALSSSVAPLAGWRATSRRAWTFLRCAMGATRALAGIGASRLHAHMLTARLAAACLRLHRAQRSAGAAVVRHLPFSRARA